MKKLMVIAASTALLAGISVSAFVADKAVEDHCKEMAKKENVAADKMAAYIRIASRK